MATTFMPAAKGSARTPLGPKLRRLKDAAAYNVAQYLSCHSEVEDLQVPISLKKLVEPFVITFSGDYIFDLNEN